MESKDKLGYSFPDPIIRSEFHNYNSSVVAFSEPLPKTVISFPNKRQLAYLICLLHPLP